jgi:hypothetical protein
MLVLKLFDSFPVLECNPNIDTPITVGVPFLPPDLSIGIEDSQVENTIRVSVPFLAYDLVILENVNGVPFSCAFGVP